MFKAEWTNKDSLDLQQTCNKLATNLQQRADGKRGRVMTREEAIKLIDTHTVCFYNEIDSPTLQALHMAIEALQTEVVRCGDCEHWNSETKGCKRNPSVEAWYETDSCSYGESEGER